MTHPHRLALAAAVALSALVMQGCEEKIKPSVLPTVDSRTLPQQESWNSHITLSDSGRITADIQSGYLRKFETPPSVEMSEGITVLLFNAKGERTSTLTAHKGKVNEITNDLEAYGNVVVVSNNGTVLKSERLFWDNKRQLIHTPDFVRITSPREKLQGYGLESDQSLKNYRISRVTGEAQTN